MGNALTMLANELTVDLSGQYANSPFFTALTKELVYQDVIRWDIKLAGGNSAESEATASVLYSQFPGVDNGTYTQDSRMGAELTIGKNKKYTLLKINKRELTVAANRGSNAVRNLLQSRVSAGLMEITEAINTSLYTGSGAGNLIGLETIFGANSYAGITHALADYTATTPNVDYYPSWRPLSGLADISAANITLNDDYGVGGTLHAATVYTDVVGNHISMLYGFDYLMRINRRRYNMIVAHPSIVEKINAEYRDKLVYNISNGEISQANEGVTVPRFNGRPVIEDTLCPANTAYFLDTNDIKLHSLDVSTSGDINVDSQLAIIMGELAQDTAMTSRWEMLVLPQLAVYDTKGLNRLQIQA